jgi:hypothetical protein
MENEMVQIKMDGKTKEQLWALAEAHERSMSAEVRTMVRTSFVETFHVVDIDALPHPEGGEEVPVVKVKLEEKKGR